MYERWGGGYVLVERVWVCFLVWREGEGEISVFYLFEFKLFCVWCILDIFSVRLSNSFRRLRMSDDHCTAIDKPITYQFLTPPTFQKTFE